MGATDVLSLKDLLWEELLTTLCHRDPPTTSKYFSKLFRVVSLFYKLKNDDLSSSRLVTIEGGSSSPKARFSYGR